MTGIKAGIRKLAVALLLTALLLSTVAVPAMAEPFAAIVTAEKMTVYGQASMSQALGTLDKYAVVRVVGYSNTIAKISYEGKIGYAKISDMKRVDAVAQKAALKSEAQAYRAPDEQSESVSLAAGTELYLLAESGDWAMIECKGYVAYVKKDLVERQGDTAKGTGATQPDAGVVQPGQETGVTVRSYDAMVISDTPVYRKASDAGKALGTLKAGTQVVVRASNSEGWAYIELNGRQAFCRLDKLKEGAVPAPTTAPTAAPASDGDKTVKRKGAVSAASTAVYREADAAGTKLGTLKMGREVNVISWDGDWAYIELNGNYGYCRLSDLVPVEDANTSAFAPSTANAKTGKVTSRTLAVYRTAGTGGTKLGTLKKGQTVNVLKTEGGWAYIELNGYYGFCQTSGLSVDKSTQSIPAGYKKADITATVITSDARVYASPNLDAENDTLKLGAELSVVAYNGSWACVERSGSYGFVPLKALSKTAYSPISGDGKDLLTLLKALLSAGYYDAEPTESYNAAAIAAIKRFQKACGLEQTGVADQNMLRIVYSGSAPVSGLLYKKLSSGDSGDDVSRLQARLYALGYLSKTTSLDGDYGNTTVAAVKLFQNASGISATGTADSATLKALYSTEAKKLPSGSKAADATTAQKSTGSSSYLDSVPNGLASTTSSYNSGLSNAEKLEHAIYLAQSKLGCPYVYGAAGPDKFDCSGLTTWIFKAVGVSLKRSAYAQGYDDSFPKIEGWQNLKRGDIVFFDTISDSDRSDHAGVYIGEGYFIHASSGGHRVVVSNLTTGYYSRVFSWGRRILK
ncbi:MAG: peptidoglycan-binding protein [Clostridia bacterium]|nr:peptidoglycan-binding protein [Clostridia bacterium]